ncbi:SirA protein [Buchnera aphidicola str. Bp (Baizongia pistaciae)]|uniref:Sulfur carrier protein TusA n=1 Tax=Buchnera aphidicola subsp. Baizongia pistaciae (strain Bp) TaxID=224915 RepID=TUSA_BUCBP|nr:sulfurtransferase TusA [Buchnera aphidicola]Q89AB9.1 RecName: Full=Sulfur carrier protein TusA; AltName: Full=Sulfur mediator TusA; AltName: Full=Sulfur transfer protein TusA; AltName: Full=tRNA 2-thiouridine synthesizing protein A [Buchnera aphidicola str. Bp (Baizongia pistaciae)]AAO27109.1 SirA protein [Buchnera aphidicola str. Bp (Baizongia pistaciae)]
MTVDNNVLDLRKLRCPEPIMLLRKKIREIKNGTTLLILSDDPSTIREIPQYCKFMHHKLLKINTKDTIYKFWIQKTHKM